MALVSMAEFYCHWVLGGVSSVGKCAHATQEASYNSS